MKIISFWYNTKTHVQLSVAVWSRTCRWKTNCRLMWQSLCLAMYLKPGYCELACLHAPSLHSFKEEYSTYGPLGGMDGSLQSEWEDMSTRSIPSVMKSSLSLKWINNGWKENSEQNKRIIIISSRIREISVPLLSWTSLYTFPYLCVSQLEGRLRFGESASSIMQQLTVESCFKIFSHSLFSLLV